MGTIKIGTTVSEPAVLGQRFFNHPFYVAFAAGGGLGGGEPNRKINIIRGDDLQNPTVMEERSNDAVALAWNEVPSVGDPYIQLAWTRNDPPHRLTYGISWDGVKFVTILALDDTCLGGPALARIDGSMVFAWTGGGGLGGGPPDGRVNVMDNVMEESGPTQKVVLPWKSIAGPALAADPGIYWGDGEGKRLYVAWTDADGHIYTSYCTHTNLEELNDPSHLQLIETGGNAEQTFTSPSLAFSGNQLFLAWAGTDGAHRINFKVLAGSGAGRKMTIGETATSAVAMQTYENDWQGGRYAYRGTDGVGGLYLSEPMPL